MSASKRDLRRWAGWLSLVIVFSIACAFLSNWQFNRRQEALTAMNQLSQNYDSSPVALQTLESTENFNQAYEWRQVELVGHYLPLNSLLVRNRPLNGQPGFLQVVPFQLADSQVVLVERGWIAATSEYLAPKTYPLPSGENQVVIGHLRESEPSLGRTAPAGQLATINVEEFTKKANIKDRVFSKLYVRMASESVPVTNNPKQLAKPQLDEGNHLSYALQWILFALMSAVALVWGIKKEREAISGKQRVKKRKDIGQSDAEIEDSLLGN